jgi:hypothetical protein
MILLVSIILSIPFYQVVLHLKLILIIDIGRGEERIGRERKCPKKPCLVSKAKSAGRTAVSLCFSILNNLRNSFWTFHVITSFNSGQMFHQYLFLERWYAF